jgi:hypothetical protein
MSALPLTDPEVGAWSLFARSVGISVGTALGIIIATFGVISICNTKSEAEKRREFLHALADGTAVSNEMLIMFIDSEDPGAQARNLLEDKKTSAELATVLRTALLKLV